MVKTLSEGQVVAILFCLVALLLALLICVNAYEEQIKIASYNSCLETQKQLMDKMYKTVIDSKGNPNNYHMFPEACRVQE